MLRARSQAHLGPGHESVRTFAYLYLAEFCVSTVQSSCTAASLTLHPGFPFNTTVGEEDLDYSSSPVELRVSSKSIMIHRQYLLLCLSLYSSLTHKAKTSYSAYRRGV